MHKAQVTSGYRTSFILTSVKTYWHASARLEVKTNVQAMLFQFSKCKEKMIKKELTWSPKIQSVIVIYICRALWVFTLCFDQGLGSCYVSVSILVSA